MREIIFRGKRPNSGKWITGGLVQKGAFSYILGNGHFEVECSTEVILETVGLFTGKADMNDINICEGDIIKGTEGAAKIVYSEGSFLIEYTQKCYILSWAPQGSLEIIGNIHDNPELLIAPTK